ncbi:MAG TPA: DHA2 family efflux MFS transporter permease subunit [Bacilli bacterium]
MSNGSKGTIAQEEGPKSIKDILVPLIAIIIGLFMVILDNTAVNVALPKLVEEFNSSLTVLQWTVTGYMLAQAAVIPLAGWLSDRFGAKRIFLISVGMFTVGSLLCAIASDPAQLIVFRILQGFGGGMVMPIAMAFTYRLAPPNMVGAVMGMMGIPILLAPALGPVLAGWLVDFASWNWIFIINLPIGIIGVFIGIRYLPKIDRQQVASLDVWGMILGPLAFAALVYGVSEGAQSWTSLETILGTSIGVVSLILFITVELRQPQPMLELRVFRSFDFTRAIIIQWITTVGLFGTIFLIPLFLQQAKGYSAFDTGLIMLPQALAAAIFMPISGKLFDRIGARPLVMIGMGLIAVAAFLFSQITATDGISMLMAPLALLGAGMGLCMMPLNTHIIQASPQNLVGRVTSLTNATQLVVSSFAIAALASYLVNHMSDYMADDNTITNVEAFAMAFGDTFLIIVGISILGAILGLMLTKPKVVEGAAKPTEPSMMVG